MSWNNGCSGDKLNIEGRIRTMYFQFPGNTAQKPGEIEAVREQEQAAKRAALELVRALSGPNLIVQISGHSQVGGGGPDFIVVNVGVQP